MISILWTSSFRYLWRHPWQFGLSILGIALGVAVVISIDLTNESAKRAFVLSVESVIGTATHQIVDNSGWLAEATYVELRRNVRIRDSAPIVEGRVAWAKNMQWNFQILGVDPFAEAPFRSYLQGIGVNNGNNTRTDRKSDDTQNPDPGSAEAGSHNGKLGSDAETTQNEAGAGNTGNIIQLLTQPGAVIVSSTTAQELGWTLGSTFSVQVGSHIQTLTIIGFLTPQDEAAQQAIRNLIIADIATAQEVLGQIGKLSRIDLILPVGEQRSVLQEKIQQILPPDAKIIPASERVNTAEKLTRSFHLNLAALSLLTLIVGMFLIYNTMTFSVVQRYSLLGRLRTLGMTRREMFGVIASEALCVGALGTGIGVALGIGLAHGLLGFVTQTINDLYYAVSVQQVHLSGVSLFKGVGLGMGATFVAALFPALEAARIPPRTVLNRSQTEEKRRRSLLPTTFFGGGLLVLGWALLQIPSTSLVLSYAGIFGLIVGFALLMPGTTVLLMFLVQPLLSRLFGTLGVMATRGVRAELSRTSVAIAALMVAISSAIALGIMVGSFRTAVITWLDSELQADVYVSLATSQSARRSTFFEPELIEQVKGLSGIAETGSMRRLRVPTESDPALMLVVEVPSQGRHTYLFKERGNADPWQAFLEQESILISESFAYRRGLKAGDSFRLHTPQGWKSFRIAAVSYAYSYEQGYVIMHRRTFETYWKDSRIQGLSVYLTEEASPNSVIEQIESLAPMDQPLLMRSNRFLREYTLEVFDRTFAITLVLRLLIAGVAFIGVLSALMALQLEREKELGVLRAIGFTPREVWQIVTTQCGLMGLVAGLMAWPVGIALALVLIYVINQRSFGWTFPPMITPELLVQGLLLALIAALLAGLYPAWKMARTAPAVSLREE